jgi:hypothetical protein
MVDSDTSRRVAELRNYFNKATPAEQEKMAKDFDERVNKYMDPELKSAIATGGDVENVRESADVTEDDNERVKELGDITYALENYPDIPYAQKKGVEDMIYGLADNANEKIVDAIRKDKSDKNIEQ